MRLVALLCVLATPALSLAEEASDQGLALSVSAANAAPAQVAAPSAGAVEIPTTTADTSRAEARPLPRFGLLLDGGVPDGVAASILYRPFSWIRFTAGPLWNYGAWGGQVGVALTPLRWAITPSLCLDAGKYFKTAHTFRVEPEDVDAFELDTLYRFASLQLGLELGSQRGFAFFVRAGFSYFEYATQTTLATTGGGGVDGANDVQVRIANPKVTATVPSAKLGFLLFF